jgi:hypothetical protein
MTGPVLGRTAWAPEGVPPRKGTRVHADTGAQTHALRAAADFLDHLHLPDLSLVFNRDQITVQVPAYAGDPGQRTATVTALAGALGTRAHHDHSAVDGHHWVVADAQLAGHRVHVFTTLPATTGQAGRPVPSGTAPESIS